LPGSAVALFADPVSSIACFVSLFCNPIALVACQVAAPG
jgi:hypothetical protein